MMPTSVSPSRSETNANQQRYFGVSKPISLDYPTETELLATKALEETLRSSGYFESEEDLQRRIDVMVKLNDLVKKWIKDVSIQKHLPAEIVNQVGGGVRTFGSFRLGVHSKGGDIDTVLIAPYHIQREDFFTSFVEKLRAQSEVRDLRSVPGAFVPVIKFEFDGIELDMVFARLTLSTIPDQLDLNDDQILLNLDPWSVRSLNGCRVADEILQLVPDQQTFRSTLRAIKFWAKNTGLYSNALGFFGGVTWAILVARICQLYPHATAATLVQKFFRVYSGWSWPTAVYLKEIRDAQLGFTIWDPNNNPRDREHRMPIITPAYPQQNSTHNVTLSTQKIIVQEIQRGHQIVQDIMASKATWEHLFVGIPFFDRYKHYVVLVLSAPDQNQLVEWSGLIEANIRRLIQSIERDPSVDVAHVSPEKYTPHENLYQQLQSQSIANNSGVPAVTYFRETWVVGLRFNKTSGNLDLTENLRSFRNFLDGQAVRTNRYYENICLDAQYVRGRDIPKFFPNCRPTRTRTEPVANPADTMDRQPKRKLEDSEQKIAADQIIPNKQLKLDQENGEAV